MGDRGRTQRLFRSPSGSVRIATVFMDDRV
jgi:hypothetical protein